VVLFGRGFQYEICIVGVGEQRDERHGLVNDSSILPMTVVAIVMQNVKVISADRECSLNFEQFF